jgi:hypothetical protein
MVTTPGLLLLRVTAPPWPPLNVGGTLSASLEWTGRFGIQDDFLGVEADAGIGADREIVEGVLPFI